PSAAVPSMVKTILPAEVLGPLLIFWIAVSWEAVRQVGVLVAPQSSGCNGAIAPYGPVAGQTKVMGSKLHAVRLSITPSTNPSSPSHDAIMALVKSVSSAKLKDRLYCGNPFGRRGAAATVSTAVIAMSALVVPMEIAGRT